MFPVLTAAQCERIAAHGRRRATAQGEVLYDVGAMPLPFIVVVSGEIELLHPSEPTDTLIQALGPGQFTGEFNLLAGRRALARARVREAGEVLELSREQLQLLIQTDSELSEILMRAFILRRVALMERGLGDVVLIGSEFCAGTLRVKQFLARNAHPYTYLDLEQDADVQLLLDRFQVSVDDIPVLICRGSLVLRNPTNRQIAECLGLNESIDATHIRDVLIVGAGPSGLAAAVFAASEGLDVLVIEANVPGGQAGTSSKIENFFGFPTGITGQALTGRGFAQAQKFGAQVMVASGAVKIAASPPALSRRDRGRPERGGPHGRHRIRRRVPQAGHLEPGAVRGLRRLLRRDLHGIAALPGRGSRGHRRRQFGGPGRRVPGADRRARAHTRTRRRARRHDVALPHRPHRAEPGDRTAHPYRALRTRGRQSPRARDLARQADGRKQDVRDPAHIHHGGRRSRHGLAQRLRRARCEGIREDGLGTLPTRNCARPEWPLARSPLLLETSLPGVFAVGDVRGGNVKRVASAVGEGSISVAFVHQVLGE